MRIGCLVAKYFDGSVKCIEASDDMQSLRDLKKSIKLKGGIKGVSEIYLLDGVSSKDKYKEVVEVKDEKPKGRK